MIRTYDEMIKLQSFKDRYEYLKLNNQVSSETFGWHRYLNQALYKSEEWRSTRNAVIVRDNGCDLADQDFPILGNILVHHINPITIDDVVNRSPKLFDMNNLVCVSHLTHNMIHYGNDTGDFNLITERVEGDTKLW